MSELFAVRVVEVSPGSAKLAVRSVHPDSGPPAPTATFALQLVYDPILNSAYSDFKAFRHLQTAPLASAMDVEAYLDSDWMRKNARAFVAKARVSKGVLEVWPTHPAWIEHLRKGMSWETAAYDIGPGEPAKPQSPAPPGAVSVRSQDPAEGFRRGKPKYPEIKLKGVFIALHGASHYIADPVVKKPDEMAKAAKELIGQPLLLVQKRGPVEIGSLVKLLPNGVYIYRERSNGGYGLRGYHYEDLKSIGRAWLKVGESGAVSETPAAKPAKKATKTAAKKIAKPAKKVAAKAATKPAKKVAAKAAAKAAAQPAKPANRVAAKAAAKPAKRVAAKAAVKPAKKVASKAAAKPARPAKKVAAKATKRR